MQEELTRPQGVFLVAEAGTSITGYCIAWMVLEELQIMDVFVCSSHRRQGWARSLMQALLTRYDHTWIPSHQGCQAWLTAWWLLSLHAGSMVMQSLKSAQQTLQRLYCTSSWGSLPMAGDVHTMVHMMQFLCEDALMLETTRLCLLS